MATAALLNLLRSRSTRMGGSGAKIIYVSSQNLLLSRFAAAEDVHKISIRLYQGGKEQRPIQWSWKKFNLNPQIQVSDSVPREEGNEEKAKFNLNPQIQVSDSVPREEGNEEKETLFVYQGPKSNNLREFKRKSTFLSCLCVPVVSLIPFTEMIAFEGPNHIWFSDYLLTASHAALCGVVFLNASVTAFLHWFTRSYVDKLVWQPGSDSFEVEVISWWGSSLPRTTIKFADIRDPESYWPILWSQPDDRNLYKFYAKTKYRFGHFKANGRLYFVEHEHFHNKELLAKLTTFVTR